MRDVAIPTLSPIEVQTPKALHSKKPLNRFIRFQKYKNFKKENTGIKKPRFSGQGQHLPAVPCQGDFKHFVHLVDVMKT